MDIPQQRQRVTVDGLGDIGVGKWKKSVDLSVENDIINTETYYGGLFRKNSKNKGTTSKKRFEKIGSYFFESFNIKNVRYCRIDNVYFSNLIKECIE